jgi:hypothetical protein
MGKVAAHIEIIVADLKLVVAHVRVVLADVRLVVASRRIVVAGLGPLCFALNPRLFIRYLLLICKWIFEHCLSMLQVAEVNCVLFGCRSRIFAFVHLTIYIHSMLRMLNVAC